MANKRTKSKSDKAREATRAPNKANVIRIAIISIPIFIFGVGIGAVIWFALPRSLAPAKLTFNKDIAPIVFQHCSGCHRPGESAPFPLLTYQDAKKRARQMAEVTRKRYMPPVATRTRPRGICRATSAQYA